MAIKCMILVSESVPKRPELLNVEIGIHLAGAIGKGYIGGGVTVAAGETDFTVSSYNNLGLPDDLCREFLLAAFAACGRPAGKPGVGAVHGVPNLRHWLHTWFRASAAGSIALALEQSLARP